MNREQLQTEDDVDAILRIAVRKSGNSDSDLRDRLQAAAGELGIAPEALAAAEREYFQKSKVEQDLLDYTKRKRQDFKGHFAIYIIVITCLFAMNFFTERGNSNKELWAIFPMLGWGIGIAIHGFTAMMVRPSLDDPEFKKWRAEHRSEDSPK